MSDSPRSSGSGGILPEHLDRSLVGRMPARLALAVLGFAEEPGLPPALWRSGAAALAGPGGGDVTDEQLLEFARGPAMGVVSAAEDPDEGACWTAAPTIEAPAAREEIQRRLTVAWLAHGRDLGWRNAPSYLLRNLPRHALEGGLADALLEDDGYLAYADLERLAQVAPHVRTRAGRLRAALLELTPGAAGVTGLSRAAMFGVTAVLEGLGPGTDAGPYRGLWARTGGRGESDVLTGHTDDVDAACQVLVAGEPALATGGRDKTVRLWDPVTARLDRVLRGHTDRVRAVCAVSGGVASGGGDHTVRLWDPLGDQAPRVLAGHTAGVTALCRVTSPEGEWLASGGEDFTVRLWDTATGLTVRTLTGHNGSITALCEVTVDGLTLLASASRDGTVRLWDPGTGRTVREHGLRGEYGMCALTVEGRAMLATAGSDKVVRLSDLAADAHPEVIARDVVVDALCAVEVEGRPLLAIGENAGPYRNVVRLWDPAARRAPRETVNVGYPIGAMCAWSSGGRTRLAVATANGDVSQSAPGDGSVLLIEPDGGDAAPVSHSEPVTSLAAVPLGRGNMIASASSDHSVRLWDPATGRAAWATRAHVTEVRAICRVLAAEGALLASAGDSTVRLWRTDTGEEVNVLRGHTGAVASVCAVTTGGHRLLASGAYDREIRLWDLGTGRTVRTLEHPGSVYALTTVELDGRTVLMSAGAEGTLVQWDPATGSLLRHLDGGRTGWINGLCVVPAGASALLASAGSDGTVRLWDLGTGAPHRILTGHTGEVRGVCPVSVDGTVLLASAGRDARVRLWDPDTGDPRAVIPVHAPATACAEVDGTLIVGLDTGLLAIRLGPGA